MLKIDFSKLIIQTVIHLHTFILQNLLALLIFQYKSLFGSGLSRLGVKKQGEHQEIKIFEFISEYPDEESCKRKFKSIRDKEGVVCRKSR